MSDVHLNKPGDETTFLKALGYFRDHGADGVLIAGDIADSGRAEQLKRCADCWYRTFPDGKAPDGRPVEQLFVYGNHDIDSWKWKSNAERYKANPELKKTDAIGFEKNRARVWEELFHEKFEPIWMKRVKDAKKGDLVEITFPAAQTRAKCRVFEYEVTAVLVEDDVDLVQLQRRVMAPDFHLPETKEGVAGRCVIAAADLPMKGRYRFDVRPVECFGLKGRAIHATITCG